MPARKGSVIASGFPSKERAARVFTGGMPRTLGMRLISISRKRVVSEMPIGPMHMNPGGNVNGGAIMSLADATGAVGAVANLPAGHRTGTLESKTNFLASGYGPVLRAVSISLHIGRTTSVWQTTITDSGSGKRVAVVTQTQIYLPRNLPASADSTKLPSPAGRGVGGEGVAAGSRSARSLGRNRRPAGKIET